MSKQSVFFRSAVFLFWGAGAIGGSIAAFWAYQTGYYPLAGGLALLFGVVAVGLYGAFFRPLQRLSAGEPITVGQADARLQKLAAENARLREQEARATEFVEAIEQAQLDVAWEETDGTDSDLRRALVSMREHLRRIKAEENERNWATEGLARFVEILRRNDDDLSTLGNRIISELVGYVEANQGALYLLYEGDEAYLEQVACYAYGRQKHDEQRIEIGEGLVGQVVLEREHILLTEVPEDYVQITSGLGEAPPRAVLIMPLLINEQIMGVVELAAFSDFPPYQVAFVQKLAENIASTLAAVRSAEGNRLLLEESKLQTEQMRAQEEEMRQNMEELMTTQEQQERLQAELKKNEEALKEKLEQLEEAHRRVEEVKVIEAQRAQEQIEKRNQMMQKVQQKFKAREAELLATIESLKT